MLVTRDGGMAGRDGSWPGARAKVRHWSRTMPVADAPSPGSRHAQGFAGWLLLPASCLLPCKLFGAGAAPGLIHILDVEAFGSNPTCWPLACLFVCWGVHSGLGKAGVG